MRGIDGHVFVVTGAGSGIGAAVATRLIAEGAKVAVVDRNAERTRTVAEALGANALAVVVDVSTESGVAAYMTAALERWGPVRGVHLNAASEGFIGRLIDSEVRDFDDVMAVNARGVFLGIRAAVRSMLHTGTRGSIVVTASTAGLSGSATIGSYSASKHAAVGLVRAAALDHGRDGIRVNAICPGETDTPLLRRFLGSSGPTSDARVAAIARRVPLGRVAQPEEMASAAVWLLSEESSYVTGTALVVDGGLTAGRFSGE